MRRRLNDLDAAERKIQVLRATNGGMPIRYAARHFSLSVGTVRRWRKQFAQTGIFGLIASGKKNPQPQIRNRK